MPWTLEIHNLDVSSSGDSTVIIARHPGPMGGDPIVRTVLIDAGKASNNQQGVSRAEAVHLYLVAQGIAHVDVMIATHYDNDHYSGLHYLLSRDGTNLYSNAIVYDQGQPPNTRHYYQGSAVNNQDGILQYRRPGNKDYLKYLDAINKKPNVTRATLLVNSFDIVSYDEDSDEDQNQHDPQPNIPAPVWIDAHYYNGVDPEEEEMDDDPDRPGDVRPVRSQRALPSDWLVGKEVMWGNGGDGKNGRAAFAHVAPGVVGFPTLTCICANKWTYQGDGTPNSFVSDKVIYDGDDREDDEEIANIENGFNPDGGGSPNDNAKSLGFILQFNEFKYYIAGDLEKIQEDGHINRNSDAQVFKRGVRYFLNPQESMNARVAAMHCSHHGSNTATSRDFVESLIPSAAFISCSNGNQFAHPHQEVINVLDGYQEVPINSKPAVDNQHPNRPPPPPFTPVTHYLTGFSAPDEDAEFDDQTFGGDASFTAGSPNDETPGHIVLRVSEAESGTPKTGQTYRNIHAVLAELNARFVLNLTAARIHDVADYGAIYGGYAAVGSLLQIDQRAWASAARAVAWMGEDKDNRSLVRTAHSKGSVIEAFDAIKNDDRMDELAHGTANAIASAVQGGSLNQIKAAALAGGATEAAAVAAASAASTVAQFGLVQAGYAAVAALGAVGVEGGTTQAGGALFGAVLGTASLGAASDAMCAAIYDASRAAGMNQNTAATAAAVATTAYCGGSILDARRATYRAMRKAGNNHETSTASQVRVRNAVDRTRGGHTNDLFQVSFSDENPGYDGNNPRTITHTS